MPTLGESPEASSVLHDIKPDEVSAVDMPANGEPMIVVKSMSVDLPGSSSASNRLDTGLKDASEPVYDSSNLDVTQKTAKKQGGPEMAKPKLDEKHVPRQVMKVVKNRVSRIIDDIAEFHDVAKNLKVAEDGSQKAPQFLTDMAKSISADLRSLLPDNEVTVEKRGVARSVLSLQNVTKQVEDREKANAVSYLVRDRYVSVSQSLSEYMTTYVQGIESDDAGPILIPDDLDETVEKSATELDTVVAETEEKIEQPAEQTPADVQKSFGAELVVREGDMTVRDAFDRIMKAIADGGTQMSTPTTETTTKTETTPTASEETTETQPTETSEATPSEPAPAAASEQPESKPVEVPAAKGVDGDAILAAIAAMEKKFDTKFDDVRKEIGEVREVATGASEKVDKAMRTRADSRGGQASKTTKPVEEPTEKRDDNADGSFAGVLGLPKQQ